GVARFRRVVAELDDEAVVAFTVAQAIEVNLGGGRGGTSEDHGGGNSQAAQAELACVLAHCVGSPKKDGCKCGRQPAVLASLPRVPLAALSRRAVPGLEFICIGKDAPPGMCDTVHNRATPSGR